MKLKTIMKELGIIGMNNNTLNNSSENLME